MRSYQYYELERYQKGCKHWESRGKEEGEEKQEKREGGQRERKRERLSKCEKGEMKIKWPAISCFECTTE